MNNKDRRKQGRIHGCQSRMRVGRGRAGGQGPYLRSLDHLGRSGEVKKVKQIKKVKWGPTNQPTNQPTDQRTDKAGCRVA